MGRDEQEQDKERGERIRESIKEVQKGLSMPVD